MALTIDSIVKENTNNPVTTILTKLFMQILDWRQLHPRLQLQPQPNHRNLLRKGKFQMWLSTVGFAIGKEEVFQVQGCSHWSGFNQTTFQMENMNIQ